MEDDSGVRMLLKQKRDHLDQIRKDKRNALINRIRKLELDESEKNRQEQLLDLPDDSIAHYQDWLQTACEKNIINHEFKEYWEVFFLWADDKPERFGISAWAVSLWCTVHNQSQPTVKYEPTTVKVESEKAPETGITADGEIAVDTYQVAVPKGDCSIHLLVRRWKDPPKDGRARRGVIQRAILVDGGNSHYVSGYGILASAVLRGTIAAIEQDYQQRNQHTGQTHFMGPWNRLKFDAWIVTH
ncbi:hypothetical protein BJX64DRAFT_291422 [Aspergillus heterothallicus]